MRSQLLGCVLLSTVFACASGAPDEAGSATSAADLEQEAAPTLTFAADWSVASSGALRAGQTFTVKYAEARASECAATEGGKPVYATTGYAKLGDGAVQSFWAAGLHSNPASVSQFTLPQGHGGDLAVWFESTNKYGCHSYDSAFGANYHFAVQETRNLPDWIGEGTVVVSRETCGNGPCDADRHPITGGFLIDTWARERAAIKRADFRVWEPGLTDVDDANLWEKLDAEVHWRAGGSGDYQTAYVTIDGRVGNDVRYALDLMSLDPLGARNTIQDRSQCPAQTLTVSPDGQTVSVPVDYYFTVQGAEYRPDGGGTFAGTFANYKQLYAICLP